MTRLNELSETFRHYNGDKYKLMGECRMFPDTPAVRLVKLPQTFSGIDEVVISLDIFEEEFIPFSQWSSNQNMERDFLLARMHEVLLDESKLNRSGRILLGHLKNIFTASSAPTASATVEVEVEVS